jgi:hypothetical protein
MQIYTIRRKKMEVFTRIKYGKSLKTWLHIWARNRHQQEEEEPVLQTTQTHDHRKFWLWFTGTCRSQVILILIGNEAVLLEEESMQCCSLITTFCRTGGIKLGKLPSILILKRDLKSPQLIQIWQEMIQLTLTILSLIMHIYLYFITE